MRGCSARPCSRVSQTIYSRQLKTTHLQSKITTLPPKLCLPNSSRGCERLKEISGDGLEGTDNKRSVKFLTAVNSS